MNYFMGIDLGTSSTKTLIMDENGKTAGIGNASYGIQIPQISYAEQELLESIVKNTSRSLQDIYTVLGKVYDDELALDLNIQAAGYSGIKEKAANCLFETGNVPPLLGVMERAKRWGMLQAKTALNVNTGYMANMLAKEERLRRSDMQKATQKLEICGKESETIAREFLNLEEKNIRILQNYCRKKEKKSAKNG